MFLGTGSRPEPSPRGTPGHVGWRVARARDSTSTVTLHLLQGLFVLTKLLIQKRTLIYLFKIFIHRLSLLRISTSYVIQGEFSSLQPPELILIICRFWICKLAYSLKCICNGQICIWGALAVTADFGWSLRNLHFRNHTLPAEVEQG